MLALILVIFIFSISSVTTEPLSAGSENEVEQLNLLSDFVSLFDNINDRIIRDKRSIKEVESEKLGFLDTNSDYANENITEVNNATLKRNPVQCVVLQLERLQKRLKNELKMGNFTFKFESVKKSQQDFLNKFDARQFAKFCGIYNESKTKLASCPNSTMLLFISRILKIPDFMCQDRYNDVIKYVPCLKNISGEMEKTCKSNCSYSEPAELSSSTNRTNLNITAVLTSLDNECKAAQCLVKCQSPVIERKCTTSAKKLFQDAIRTIFTSIEDILGIVTKVPWPKSCRDITKGTFE